jgi:glycosyltransferase involved in cell wall biosynthesis
VRILVVTVVHHPEDSRIRHRQIAALLDAGWDVTYAAPFSGYEVPVGADRRLAQLDVPRAMGRRRLRALRAARQLLRQHGPAHDVVLLHDPELLAALPGLSLPPVVWDVHEDTAAAVTLKPWLPRSLKPAVSWAFKRLERLVERRVHLILAEHAYQDRFRHPHLVVRNVNRVPATVPPPDQPRVVYVGSVTRARGAVELVDVAGLIARKTGGALRMTVVGPAAPDVEDLLRSAADDGVLDWPGFLPSEQALALVAGSIAGLSLLHDEPNYRVSMPTKVMEYMALGVPVVTTPLPLATELVEDAECGVVVPFGDARAAADAVLDLWADPHRRRAMGAAGHRVARDRFDWEAHAQPFVAKLEAVAGAGFA